MCVCVSGRQVSDRIPCDPFARENARESQQNNLKVSLTSKSGSNLCYFPVQSGCTSKEGERGTAVPRVSVCVCVCVCDLLSPLFR